jgi:formamidopyrimidine-DNA glycosylase
VPELPEVETVRRGLAAAVLGKRLTVVEQRRKDLRVPFPAGFVQRLSGRRLEDIARRGKYLLWRFDDGTVLLAHLGMSGRMTVRHGAAPAAAHEHVAFRFADDTWVTFCDPRRFGLMALTTATDAAQHPLLAGMGAEPLDDAFDAAYLAAVFKGRKAPLKNALMDQRLIAGLGNIYVCEAMFRAGLSPFRAAGSLTKAGIAALVVAIKTVLTDAIAAGGSSLRDYRRASGELGLFQHRWAVYGREGEKCPRCRPGWRCRVERSVQGGRSTFYCPRLQR